MPPTSLSSWVQQNKLPFLIIVLLSLLVAFSLLPKNTFELQTTSTPVPGIERGSGIDGGPDYSGKQGVTSDLPLGGGGEIIAKYSSLSLLVSDVRKSADQVISYAKREGGYFVSQDLTSPEEAPLATVSVRIPASKLESSISYFRSLSVKVSSENIVGTDITRQSQDLDAQVKVIQDGIKKLTEIRDRATLAADILSITKEILSLQQQLEYLVSQKKYLAEAAGTSLVTIHLSTDELALPYTPPTGFRPDAIFKAAVRDLMTSLYRGGEALIWLAVYSVIWVPLVLLAWYLLRKFKIF